MNKPTLVIMAAGMGSRYGGLKQVDPVTDKNEIIMDFSLYDAHEAGFEKVIFVIKDEMKEAFEKLIGENAGKYMETKFAFQRLSDLPEGYEIPEGREKPWGTSHAIWCCRDLIDGPFAVINADDYYGKDAFKTIYNFLESCDDSKMDFCMVSYELKNTITENGHVARGVINVNEDGTLDHIVERTKIQRVDGKICFTEDDGDTWEPLEEETLVSMNFWGYTSGLVKELGDRFPAFLDKALVENPMKGEYLIPTTTDELIREGKASVKVLASKDKWYGVTYKEDKPMVVAALQELKDKGEYPDKLWE